uniref:Uncharacterized protein n=1 Tax=Anguilla anguilla TaxID=7936 RepID=A0A0E9Q995_ANGAN
MYIAHCFAHTFSTFLYLKKVHFTDAVQLFSIYIF